MEVYILGIYTQMFARLIPTQMGKHVTLPLTLPNLSHYGRKSASQVQKITRKIFS